MTSPIDDSTALPTSLVHSDTIEKTETNLVESARSGQMTIGDLFSFSDQLQANGHLLEASNLYALWLDNTKNIQKYVAFFNWGALLQKMGKFQEAILVYRKAVELNPLFLQAQINMGLTFEKIGQDSSALEAWAQVVAQRYLVSGADQELLATAFNHIGRLHENHRHYSLAEQALEQSLLINPKQPGVIQHWIHIRQKSCCWPVYHTLPNVTYSDLRQATSPLAMLALTDDPVSQLLCAQNFVSRVFNLQQEYLCDKSDYHHAKLRVGYVSGDFKEHAVGFLLPAFLGGHDRQQYEVYGYDFSDDAQSTTRAHIFSKLDHVRAIHTQSDREAALQIVADEIDILVDLHGLSSGARPGIFALHPAPKQATYLGFIGSTGMPWFDHVITDRHAMPAELCEYFVEKPLYVDGSFIPLIRNENSLPPVSRALLGIADDVFLMAAFGNVYKITPEMFQCWARLLKRIPSALLWLIDDNPDTTSNLKQSAMKAGLRADQILFTPRTGHAEFCSRLGLADVYLDTYPYNCGSTSNDVIQAGTPLVTMYGRTMVSRMGLSILNAVGLTELATNNLPDYEAKVVEIWLRKKASLQQPGPLAYQTINVNGALAQINTDPTLNTLATERSTAPKHEQARLLAYRFDPEPKKAKPTSRHWTRLPLIDATDHASAEFATIRHHLLTVVDHQESAFIGYFAGENQSLFGLEMPYARQFVEQCPVDADVILFSPCWDMSAFFINPFVQGEYFNPGTLATFQYFAKDQGLAIDLSVAVMHSENTCFENMWVAKRSFWLLWLELTEKYTNWMRLHHPDTNPFEAHLYQRLVNLLLISGQHEVVSHDIFKLQPTGSFLSNELDLAVELNALKQSCATGTREESLKVYHKSTQEILHRPPVDLTPRELSVRQLNALTQVAPKMNIQMENVHFYHIGYSPETIKNLPDGFKLLDNENNIRPDWFEYWPIRNFLLNTKLKEDHYYGFFSPKFGFKTGHNYNSLMNEISTIENSTEVIFICPQPEIGSLFLNPYQGQEFFDSGSLDVCQNLFNKIELDINLNTFITDSRNTVFSNYFIAKPVFWAKWLDVCEKIFTLAESEISEPLLKDALNKITTYPNAQRKIFVIERIATILIKKYQYYAKSIIINEALSAKGIFYIIQKEAIICESLKIAYQETKEEVYLDLFNKISQDTLENFLLNYQREEN